MADSQFLGKPMKFLLKVLKELKAPPQCQSHDPSFKRCDEVRTSQPRGLLWHKRRAAAAVKRTLVSHVEPLLPRMLGRDTLCTLVPG